MTTARYNARWSRSALAASFDLRGDATELRGALAAAGLPFPDLPNRWISGNSGARLLRLGPKRIVILADAAEEAALENALVPAFASCPVADFANISDMLARYTITGPGVYDILKQGTAFELSETAFPANAATVTELWTVPVILLRETITSISLLVDCAFSGFIENWLDAANGFEGGPRPGIMVSPPSPYKP